MAKVVSSGRAKAVVDERLGGRLMNTIGGMDELREIKVRPATQHTATYILDRWHWARSRVLSVLPQVAVHVEQPGIIRQQGLDRLAATRRVQNELAMAMQ